MLLLLPVVGQAQFTCTTNADNTLTITGYGGSNGVVLIPGAIGGLPVTAVGDWAFYATGVTNVLIPDSVTDIGDGAFFDCESLTNATLGNSVTNLGDWAFAFCPGLTSICCRGNPPALGGQSVLYGNLAAFYYLSGAAGWEPTFAGHPAILWNPDVPFNYATNGDGLTLSITRYTGAEAVASIPGAINFLPVTGIAADAFDNCFNLTGITIPQGVVSMGNDAFAGCRSLASVVIPDGVTAIATGVFGFCGGLTNVTIPASLTSIGMDAFALCSNLTSIDIPVSVTNIGDAAFSGCSRLTDIRFPGGVTSIGNYEFFTCVNLAGFTIPLGVTNIGGYAFAGCPGLTSLTVPAGVSNLADGAFAYCFNLKSVFFNGDAPGLGGAVVFYDVPDATVYYLPGTSGWSDFSIQTGVPTALWLPRMQAADSSFGVRSNQFGFNLNWAGGRTVVVEACSNLAHPDWQPVQTNTLTTGTAGFSDPQWTNYPARFYRLRSP